MPESQLGGFGTRIYFLPNSGMSPRESQIIKGSGYASINVKGAHYRSEGNLWQQLFGGSDKVSLSTQIDYVSGNIKVSSSSIEEMREIEIGHPYYFDSGRSIALKLPTDCDAIEMTITISAVQNDNLSGALNILNSGELHGTLQLASPAISSALAIGGIVKKLLTNTDPQKSLQGGYSGKLSSSPLSDPIRDYSLAQGTLVLIYREADDDTSLDNLDFTKLITDGDGLKYEGTQVQNTYVMFQISYDDVRGEDTTSAWSQMFSDAEASLNALQTANTDADKKKVWDASVALYQQAVKLLRSDPSYTAREKKGLAASRFKSLQQACVDNGGQPLAPGSRTLVAFGPAFLSTDSVDEEASEYRAMLARAKLSLPEASHRPGD